MVEFWSDVIWQQFGASIDAMERAIVACPDEVWADSEPHTQPWYLVAHTLFWLEFYLSDDIDEEKFVPPTPLSRSEFDSNGLMPERIYSREEMLASLANAREHCRQRIAAMTDAEARRVIRCPPREFPVAEWLLYNLRHVQHHTAQLNLLLRQRTGSAPRWVSRAGKALGGE